MNALILSLNNYSCELINPQSTVTTVGPWHHKSSVRGRAVCDSNHLLKYMCGSITALLLLETRYYFTGTASFGPRGELAPKLRHVGTKSTNVPLGVEGTKPAKLANRPSWPTKAANKPGLSPESEDLFAKRSSRTKVAKVKWSLPRRG